MTIERSQSEKWIRPASRKNLPGHRRTRAATPTRMSERDFSAWIDEDTRAEWTQGEITVMSPVSLMHDTLQGWIYRLLSEIVELDDLGRVGGSELFVRLPDPVSRRLTDAFFVTAANEKNFRDTYYDGAPDLIVEIVSADSAGRDYREKFLAYQAAGVREYWIIDPLAQKVEVHELHRGKYRQATEKDGIVKSRVIKNFWIKTSWLWQKKLPKLAAVLKELGIK